MPEHPGGMRVGGAVFSSVSAVMPFLATKNIVINTYHILINHLFYNA